MTETFHGYIETTQDVLLIFEGCRRGLIPRVCRRLQEKERRMIRSGSVFVFDERESGIKRWTDGLVWSPSRILGNFLIYRELDKRVPGDKKLSISSASSNDSRQRSYSADQSAMGGVVSTAISTDRNRERRLVGSLSDSYRFRKDGLIKKTMSIMVNGVAQHLISYYLPSDIIANKLRTPSSVPELASLEISPDLLVKQNFRIPPMVEPSFDQNEAGLTADDRRIHPLRSMSMSSLRAPTGYHHHHNGGGGGSRADLNTTNSQQFMYTTTPSLAQRMDIDDTNNPNKYTTTTNNNNLSAYYGSQTMSTLYNNSPTTANTTTTTTTTTTTNNNNNNNNNNGFPPLPSPSSMTSSPNTPMLSPVRQSFSQQSRHYSMSSSSSGSIPRYGRNSFDMMSTNTATGGDNRTHPSIHPHMIPEVNIYGNNDDRIKLESHGGSSNSYNILNDSTTTTNAAGQGFSSSPNIGQLLNPVHPLNTTAVKHETNDTNAAQQQFFQTMTMNNNNNHSNNNSTAAYSDYSTTNGSTSHSNKLTSDNGSHHDLLQQQQQQQQNNFYGGNYYFQRQQQHHHQQQPLTNTHSATTTTSSSIAASMFRNGMTLPHSSSTYDDTQNGPELGMEPLMLK
ncbi:MAG: Gti1/Pac2 family-domain-containing protein [Benjaminiella poitrasii]|nr:MAG: Gti1/Pac2 family-domain-containing protein [Benjaminiella poitrasii]